MDVASAREQQIVKDVVARARQLMPDFQVRFVQRVEDGGSEGLLIGATAPGLVASAVLESQMLVHDDCNRLGSEVGVPLGVSFTVAPSKKVPELGLGFLADDMVAERELRFAGVMNVEKMIYVIPVVLLLAILLPLLLRWWQESNERREGEKKSGMRMELQMSREEAVQKLERYQDALTKSGKEREAATVERAIRQIP